MRSTSILVCLFVAACGAPTPLSQRGGDAAIKPLATTRADTPPGSALPLGAPAPLSPCHPTAPYAPPVNAPCGNGVIDSLGQICAPCVADSKSCPCSEAFEPCDGKDTGATTCKKMGYFGGPLSCNKNCTAVSTDECEACLPGVACVSVPLAERVIEATSAARGDAIGVAWVDVIDGCEHTRFARIGIDGKILSLSPSITAAHGVTLVANDRGWILAAVESGGVSVWGIEPNGDVTGPVAYVQYAGKPTLTAGPKGAPTLLTLRSNENVYAALLSEGGSIAVAPIIVFEKVYPGPVGDAASTGDGFLVGIGRPLQNGPKEAEASVRRLGYDGSLGEIHPLVGGHVDQFYSIGWAGKSGTLMAQAGVGEYVLWNLDKDGRPTADRPESLKMTPRFPGVLDIPGKTVLTHGGSLEHQPLTLTRWDGGSVKTTPLADDGAPTAFGLHQMSGKTVATWVSLRTTIARLMIARVP